MPNMIDFYLKEDIMRRCESVFNEHLKEQNCPDETLTDEERELIEEQVDSLLEMVDRLYDPDNKFESAATMVDHLIGHIVVGKMNEARICRILNKLKGD